MLQPNEQLAEECPEVKQSERTYPSFTTTTHTTVTTMSDQERLWVRLESLKMATRHATPDQVETGAVYKIAEDYYDYIINGKKQNNGNS